MLRSQDIQVFFNHPVIYQISDVTMSISLNNLGAWE